MGDAGEWTNHSDAIMIAELGQEEFERRKQQQQKLFQKACKSGNVFGGLSIGFETMKFKKKFETVSLFGIKRVSHVDGVGAQGHARVIDDMHLHENDFFIPGRLFEVRARHSNFPDGTDDTKLGMRSLAIKFGDHDSDSPLDLILHTGAKSPFFIPDSIMDTMDGLKGNSETTKKYLLSLPVYLDAHIAGVRHLPDSYYHQYYYAQTVYDFKAKDNLQRLARFRVIPADGSTESGLLTEAEQRECWNMSASDGDQMAKDYLKQEFSERLEAGPVIYLLQVQIFQVADGLQLDHNMYNPALEWDTEKQPWTDLMVITLTNQLYYGVTEITRFNIGNHPVGVLGFHKPMTMHDFNMVPHIRMEVYEAASSHRRSRVEDNSMKYGVTVETGKKKSAGSDTEVYISIIGSKSRTSFRQLDHIFVDDFRKGATRYYTLKDTDVGEVICVKILAKGSQKNNWFLNTISVKVQPNSPEQKIFTFPCYRWFTKKVTQITIFEGSAVLPQEEKHSYLKLQRQLELQEKQDMYQWRPRGMDQGLEFFPGYINAYDKSDQLPRDVQFDDDKALEINYKKIIAGGNIAFGKIKNSLDEIARTLKGEGSIEEKKALITSLVDKTDILSYIIDHWNEDEEFGRQMLQGINPVKIRRVNELPSNFPVTQEMVEHSLEEGKTLSEEIQAQKVFIVSYPELEEYSVFRSGQERFICAPLCMLYMRHGKLVPIAIQLTSSPSESTPIFTKKDDDSEFSDWLIAKMWVRAADTNSHQLATHLLGTHLLMEPVAISMMRNLPSRHPIYKLLIPHTRFIMAINTLGREVLIPHGTAISQILAVGELPGHHIKFMEDVYRGFTFSSLDIRKGFAERGVDAPGLLPEYYYRDDSLALWDALREFIGQIVDVYYKEDYQVAMDNELAAMLMDLKHSGYHENVGIPSHFTNKEDLIHFLTCVIFCCSCQHSAVNFGQLDQYGFVPNAPPCLMQPPPSSKNHGGLTHDQMKKLLPSNNISQRMIGVANLLSFFSDNEVYFGEYPEKQFTDQEAKDAISAFQYRLKEISTGIHERNRTLVVPYIYLLPERVPNSIAI